MDKSIAQALNGLIPAFSGPIPTELQELAASLLAQSRSKASSLKADEEIARSYACANLACERLQQKLNLPQCQPRPPCPPKVYQKLYKFLEAALPPGKRRSERLPMVDRSTARPTTSPAKPKTPQKRPLPKPTTPRRKASQRHSNTDDIPKWVMPTIRHLCKNFGAPQAPPHVFAGVSSILALPSQQDGNPYSLGMVKAPALIIAVLFLAITRLSGVGTDSDEYPRQRAEALRLLKSSASEHHDREEVEEADVNECMRLIGHEGWADMDWFANIPLGGGLVAAEAGDEHGEVSDDEEGIHETVVNFNQNRDGDQNYLQAGLGTMMRDQVDYLSDRRRADYQKWKERILDHIERLKKVNERDIAIS